MSKVISVNQFLFTVDELIDLFNAKLNHELENFLAIKNKVVKSGKNLDFIGSSISIWLDIDRCLVAPDTEIDFKQAIMDSGWEFDDYKWQDDERTGIQQLFMRISPKSRRNDE